MSMIVLPFLVCLMLCLILGYLGLHVLKREVIFIDIGVAQVSAFGAVAAHVFFGFHGDSIQALLCGMGATFLAAVLFAVIRRKAGQISIEAVIGITYAVSAGGTLFVIGKGTGGHTHVQQMLSGALLWIEKKDLLWAFPVFAAAGVCLFMCRKPFRKISDDYDKAVSSGINVIGWDFLFYAITGVVITMSVRLAGVLVTFCFLIIPATFSALFSTSWKIRLLVTYLAGIVGSVMGLLFAQWLDFSVGPSVAVSLCIILVLGSILVNDRR